MLQAPAFASDSDEDEAEGGTEIHAHAEAMATWQRVGTDPRFEGVGRLRRTAIEFEHEFEDVPFEVEIEVEIEDALTSASGPGRAEIEEALVAWEPREGLTVRGGLMLVPMGRVNLHHEPDDFYSVDRPSIDQILLPSTWRELGFGVQLQGERIWAELDLMSALDPTRFDDAGITNGRTHGGGSPVSAGALVGRVEVEPAPVFSVAASGYASNLGPAADWYDASGERNRLLLPLLGAEIDASVQIAGLVARVEGVAWSMPQSDDLMEAYKADGSPWFSASAGVVPTKILGASGELAYNLLSHRDGEAALSPFVRLELYDTQRAVPDGLEPNPLRSVTETTFGVSFLPIEEVAIKADCQLRDRKYGDDELGFDFGLAFGF